MKKEGNERKISEQKAVELLRKYAPNNEAFNIVLSHSKKVQEIALRLSKGIKGIDLDFIKTAALLHDIGRFRCWSDELTEEQRKEKIRHGIQGGEILRKEGLSRHAKVAERHIGAGITKKDIKEQKLDLPLKCYIPLTKEEKIIAHADNFTEGANEIVFKKVVDRFEKELGSKYAERIIKLKEQVDSLKNGGHKQAKKRAN